MDNPLAAWMSETGVFKLQLMSDDEQVCAAELRPEATPKPLKHKAQSSLHNQNTSHTQLSLSKITQEIHYHHKEQ